NTMLPITVKRTNGAYSLWSNTAYTYDNAGRVLSEDGPLGGTNDASYYDYDLSGRRTWEIAPVGEVSTNRVATVTTWREADDQPLTVETGSVSSPTDRTLTLLQSTDYLYNTRRLVTRERMLGGGSVHAVTQHSYDTRNRRVCTAQRMNPAEFNSLTGDACALDTTGTLGPDRIQVTTLDAIDRPTKVVGGYGVLGSGGVGWVEIQMGYTPNGQVAWRQDGLGSTHRTNYAYDGYDRLLTTTFPDASYEQLTYNSRSLVTQLRNRRGQLINHAYDNAGRRSSTSSSGYPTTNYAYDGLGRETQVARSGISTIDYSYDPLGRLASQLQDGRTLSYQYDAAGRRTRLTYPDGWYVTYLYTPAGQVTEIRDSGTSTLVWYDWDKYGRLDEIRRGNGRDTQLVQDPVSRLSRLNHRTLVYTDFTYNPASQIATRTVSNDAWVWDLDVDVDRDYTINVLNQYTQAGTVSFTYDASGNLTGSGTDSYVYDNENRMTSADVGGSSAFALRYDGKGRLQRTSGGGSSTNYYVYDGDQLVAEYTGSGNVRRRFVHGAGVDDPLVWFEGASTAASNRQYLLADERGSIVGVSNNSGTVTTINVYDDWGIPGTGNAGRFGYTGQIWLPELGMNHYKARMYSPTLGRFMQTDPIGYEDGMNLYAYVGNDPMNASDPTGMMSRCAFKVCDSSPLEGMEAVHVGLMQEMLSYRPRPQTAGSGACPPGAHCSIVGGVFDALQNTGEAIGDAYGATRDALVQTGEVVGDALGIRVTGSRGEAVVRARYNIGRSTRIRINGRVRIPDGLTDFSLSEVKNVARLHLSGQLRAYLSYSQRNGLRFDLYVRTTTRLSGPLLDATLDGRINLIRVPGM
ncbi:MAG: hypothetical protein LC634_02865, partial [Sphingomonadales bacterium]|nr:hypothetical protein [Sphingomonadales bacterium]